MKRFSACGGTRASRMLTAVSRRNGHPCSILCHRLHRSSPINWIRVYSCAFVVTTSLASLARPDSGRADQRDDLAFVSAVNAEILIDCDHAAVRIKLAHPDQTKIGQIGLSICVALG
jgi:hypothetical protein